MTAFRSWFTPGMTASPPEVPDRPEVPESPSTWENVVVGELKATLGHVLRDDALVEEGDEQKEIAHEVREEYDEDRR